MSLFGKKNDTKKRHGGLADQIRCDEHDYLVWKWHPEGSILGKNSRENAIRWGSSLRVKDGEVAVFVYKRRDGSMQDYIEGPYDEFIKTANLPILSSIIGAAYDGKTPFQAEIYFINLAQIIQTRIVIPYFDIFDPRVPDFGVPVAVRGTLSFKITNYHSFVKLHRLDNFDLETFNRQVRDAVIRYTKDTVANAPAQNNIPVVQIESRIAQISDVVEYNVSERLMETFGVTVSGVDISNIEIDKSSAGYKHLVAVTKDVAAATIQAQGAANIKDIYDKQRIEAENYQETLRIQREEGQYAAHMQTQTTNIGAYQIEKQAEVGVAGANALGQMGANGAGSVDLGNSGNGSMGFNPAAMMASMAVGGAVGQNLVGTMNGFLSGSNGQTTTPPPIPVALYNIAINGKAEGPFDINALQQMAQSGKINETTLVWKPGMTSWTPLKEEQALASVVSAIPPEL